MRDEETGSLWSHLLGKCMRGELKGEKLESLPSVITDWRTWKKQYPDTDAMIWPRDTVEYAKFNTSYYQKRGMQKFVAGLVSAGKAKAYRFEDLNRLPLINDQFAGTPIVVHFDAKSGAVWAFARDLGKQTLQFEFRENRVVDQTGRAWNLKTGRTEDDEPPKELKPLVVIPSFAQAWKTFHPDSAYWHGRAKAKSRELH